MLTAVSKLLPFMAQITRQVVPAVVATLIAAGLIAAYNRAFSGHLQQPRMAAMHAASGADADEDVAATTLGVEKPVLAQKPAAYETLTLPPQRMWDKEARQDAGKDQSAMKVAAEPIPALVRAAQALHGEKAEPRSEAKIEPKTETKAEQRRVAAVEPVQTAVRPTAPAPVPVIVTVPPSVVAPPAAAPSVAAMPSAQEQRGPMLRTPVPQPQYAQPIYQQSPPPVITAQPTVTVPDKPRPTMEAQAEPVAPQRGVLGTVVDTLKPSSLFARAREFGEKIEAAGNDILPSIRQ